MNPLAIMGFLILFPFPLLVAVALLMTRVLAVRRVLAVSTNLPLVAGSVLLVALSGSEPLFFNPLMEHLMPALEIGFGLLITYLGLRSKRYFTMLLGVVATAMTLLFELVYPPAVHQLLSDRLSGAMALVIGILGTLIINYAFGYMTAYHERHKEVKERRCPPPRLTRPRSTCLRSVGYTFLADNLTQVARSIQRMRWKNRLATGYKPEEGTTPKRFYEATTFKGPVNAAFLNDLTAGYAQAIWNLAGAELPLPSNRECRKENE
jgi:hypothetical protein